MVRARTGIFAAALLVPTIVGCAPTDPSVARIRGLDGQAYVDPNLPGYPINCVVFTSPKCHIQDADLASVEGLAHLAMLIVAYLPITDAGLVHLEGLTSLTDLRLPGTAITDRGLGKLRRLNRLKSLVLADTHITDGGLKEVASHRELRELNLSGTAITDAGLAALRPLERLKSLNLFQTRVKGPGLGYLKPLTQLRDLNLGLSDIDDRGLEQLEELANITSLSLTGTTVGDAGLRHVAKLTRLVELNLRDTRITDAGLGELKGLRELRELFVDVSTRITPGAIRRLCGALPRLDVSPMSPYPPGSIAPNDAPKNARRGTDETRGRWRGGGSRAPPALKGQERHAKAVLEKGRHLRGNQRCGDMRVLRLVGVGGVSFSRPLRRAASRF